MLKSHLNSSQKGEREKDSIGNKIDRWGKTCGANVGLISEMIRNVANDVVPTIHIFSLLIYILHLDPTTSCKLLILGRFVYTSNFKV